MLVVHKLNLYQNVVSKHRELFSTILPVSQIAPENYEVGG